MRTGRHDWVVALLAVSAVLLSLLGDKGTWWEMLALTGAAAVVVLASWSLFPLAAATPLVILGVGIATVGGHLEPGLFLLSLLALQVTVDMPVTLRSLALVTAMVLTPPVLWALDRSAQIFWEVWILGIVFPAALGWGLQQQRRLAQQLADSRYALAEQVISEERQRVAREVHDLIGHGLAAMLVQIASARHVLRRDADSADEALEQAERVGRTSMTELRMTLAMLRDGASQDGQAMPSVGDLSEAVDGARRRGLDVTLRTVGDPGEVDPLVGLALYRIAQEALTNAFRHASDAQTWVVLDVAGPDATLAITSEGVKSSAPGTKDAMGGFGLIGMRERAQLVGGELEAGPIDGGWQVNCRIAKRVPS